MKEQETEPDELFHEIGEDYSNVSDTAIVIALIITVIVFICLFFGGMELPDNIRM